MSFSTTYIRPQNKFEKSCLWITLSLLTFMLSNMYFKFICL